VGNASAGWEAARCGVKRVNSRQLKVESEEKESATPV
jgi:hypothetical protein